MQSFDFIEVTGTTPWDRGTSYGYKAAEKIHQCIESYRGYFTRHTPMNWDELRGYAMAYVPDLEAMMPEIVAEARGIAHGAQVPFEDIMVINCRYEITKQPLVHECTTAAILTEATGSPHCYLVKNWDYRIGVMEHIIVLSIQDANGTNILGLTEAGQLMREGFNSHGIGMVNNALRSIHDGPGTGVPATFLRRRVLSCRTFEEARDWVTGAQRSVSNNILLMSADNQAINLEASPLGCEAIHPKAGIVTHANHFTIQTELENFRTSHRDERLRKLLHRRWGNLDAAYIKSCMADHDAFPKSICSHPPDAEAHLEDRDITVASMIVNLAEKSLEVCVGPPCSGAYKKYGSVLA